MNAPRFLLGAAALFWGAQSGFWVVAALAAVAMELPGFARWRAVIDIDRQKRVADLCIASAALAGVGCYVAFGNPRAIVLLFEWLPVILLPLVLMQLWGTVPAIRLDVIFWGLRRDAAAAAQAVNLTYPCMVAWLVGASAANQRSEMFSAGVVVLGAWALWSVRRERSRALIWGAEIALAVALGSTLHFGLHGAQLWLEGAAPDWMTGDGGSRTNPYRTSTDMGSIGDLKQSDNIVLRVKMPRSSEAVLLHRASYNEYGGVSWLARGARFVEVARAQAGMPWMLRAGRPDRFIEVAEEAIHGNPVLSLPAGALTVEGDAISMKAGTFGAVQAEAAPGYFIYRVGMGELPPSMGPPDAADLAIPSRERAAIAQSAAEFPLAGRSPEQALAALRHGLATRHTYATRLRPPAAGRTPLAEFLLGARAGHCEYFASATVLLLRSAGVPTRYATGFSLQEYDAATGSYVVRERHAHAWARAWVNGAWIDVDTTPPDWSSLEEAAHPQAARWRSRFTDAWSTLRYRYALWQRDSSDAEKWSLFAGIGALLIGWLAWRIFGGRRIEARARPVMAAQVAASTAGSPAALAFDAVVSALAARWGSREPGETLNEWIARNGRASAGIDIAGLQDLARSYYRQRFDPGASNANEHAAFVAGCAAWLASHAAA